MQRIPASVFVAPVVLAALLATALTGQERIAFRDVSHFYTPLYDYVAERQASSWLPLWNDLDHTGLPLAGETTTAFYYPLRIAIWSLRLSPEVSIAWYVWLHLSIAALTAWIAARWHGTSQTAAAFAAASYALSGPVFFLHTNLPFLVSAAWIPIALAPMLCSHKSLQGRRSAWIGFSLSMMILGGDPQTAFHCLLLLFGVQISQRIRRLPSVMRLRDLAVAVILCVALTAPQLAASTDWSLQSDRAASNDAGTSSGVLSDLFRPAQPGSSKQESFAFSVAPWHLAELLSPSPFGQLYPINTRMSLRFPDEARMWTPTLYMGLFVGLSCLAIRTRWNRRPLDRWFIVALIGIVASLGSYGLVWLIQKATGTLAASDESAGGLYWFMYWLIPGYDAFRYPAKWLPFFVVGLSISTARLLDQPSAVERIRRWMAPTFLSLFVAAISTWAIHLSHQIIASPLQTWLPKDPFWGPLQISQAWMELTSSLIHSACVTGALLVVFGLRSRYRWNHQRIKLAITLLLLVDLSLSAQQQLLTIPRSVERQILNLAKSELNLDFNRQNDFSTRWLRTRSGSGWPINWQETVSIDRAIEVEAGGRMNWFGRWHLADRTSVFNSATSIRSAAIASFWKATRDLQEGQSTAQNAKDWKLIRDWLGIQGVITTKSEATEISTETGSYELPTVIRRYNDASSSDETERAQQSISISTESAPRHDVPFSPRQTLKAFRYWSNRENDQVSSSLMANRLREITEAANTGTDDKSPDETSPNRIPINDSDSPWVHAASPAKPTLQKRNPNSHIEWECVESNPELTTFRIRLPETLLITRSIYQDGNWKAQYRNQKASDWRPLPVLSIDFLKQGVILPKGEFEIRFSYQPWWTIPSMALSTTGVLLFAVVLYRGRSEKNG